MLILSYVLGFVLAVIFLKSLLSSISRFLKKPPENTVVFVPLIDAIVLCCFIISAVIFTFVLLNDKESDVVAVITVESLFLLLFGSSMLWLSNFKIVFDEEGFRRRNFLGISRYFHYDEITAFSGKPGEDFVFYAGKKRILVDRYTFNDRKFFNYTRKRYTELHSGRYMPVFKDDIFKGHIKDPYVFIIITGIVSVFSLGAAGLFAYEYVTYEPHSYESLSFSSTTFYDFDYSDDYYILKSGDHELSFKITADSNYIQNVPALKAGCNSYSKFSVYYDSGDKFNFICDLSDDYGNVYLTLDDYNAKHNAKSPISIILVIIFLGIALMFPAMIVVGRNPVKYKKIVHLFFKEEYIIWD